MPRRRPRRRAPAGGRTRTGIIVTEPELALPDGYRELLEDLKHTVAAARWRTQRIVNTELLVLYWHLGDAVLQRQHAEGWGTRVIDRLATDLRVAFPQMRGLSRRNLVYMRTFAAAYPGDCATARCATALGSRHGPARQAHRPQRAGLCHRRGAWVPTDDALPRVQGTTGGWIA